jgi:uncharacterized protein YkwD
VKKAAKTYKPPQHKKYKPHTRHFAKVYWPYLPVLVFMLVGLPFFSNPRTALGKGRVLSYATEMSQGGLLSATNTQRAANGAGSLTISNLLSQAAQAKANDMVSRNYWSHNTPDGNPPWVFIDATGYSYKKAGENLAYGFETSADAITGWMNSPSHKANMLDTTFKHVGFGVANSPNYQNAGEMTVVVAMYADPYAAPTPEPTPVPTATPKPVLPAQLVPTPVESSAVEPTSEVTPTPSPTPSETPTNEESEKPVPVGFTTESPPGTGTSQSVSRVAAFAKGKAPWSYYSLIVSLFAAMILFAIKHALAIRRFVVHGEQLVINHPLFDVGMMAVVAVAYYATRTIGFIQ